MITDKRFCKIYIFEIFAAPPQTATTKKLLTHQCFSNNDPLIDIALGETVFETVF